MIPADEGWSWFEQPHHREQDVLSSEAAERELIAACTRCLGSADGRRLLQHLRSITVERVLGPGVSDAVLRHLEGQRSLVFYLMQLSARGAAEPTSVASADDDSDTR
jgi:hypothetical protein